MPWRRLALLKEHIHVVDVFAPAIWQGEHEERPMHLQKRTPMNDTGRSARHIMPMDTPHYGLHMLEQIHSTKA